MATAPVASPIGGVARAIRSRMTTRLVLAISALVVGLHLGFTVADVLLSARWLAKGGAEAEVRMLAARETVGLHAVAVLATVGLLLVAVRTIVGRGIVQRSSRMLELIRGYRLGRWSSRPVLGPADEWTVVEAALRGLGPQLERQIRLFVACDRKATVARLGRAYERALLSHARLVVMRARSARRAGSAAREWAEVEQAGMTMLAELGKLGRPEHPAVAAIVGSESTRTPAAISLRHYPEATPSLLDFGRPRGRARAAFVAVPGARSHGDAA